MRSTHWRDVVDWNGGKNIDSICPQPCATATVTAPVLLDSSCFYLPQTFQQTYSRLGTLDILSPASTIMDDAPLASLSLTHVRYVCYSFSAVLSCHEC